MLIWKRFFVFFAIVAGIPSPSPAQPTGNVLMRVFQIRFGGATATAFLLDFENKQYFVTARHLMVNAEAKVHVELLGPAYPAWKSFAVTVLKGKNECADVAVLVPEQAKVSDAGPLPYPYTFAFGLEVYFLGFPYGLYTSFGAEGGMGVALIKHAYISAKVSCAALIPGAPKEEEFILLDGMNNPGFSGGPVVAPDLFSTYTNIREQKLIGVIMGFRPDSSPVQVGGNALPNASVATNSGIIIAVPIDRAVELIRDYVSRQK
jgi:S1-C subfamily serine protease